MAAPEELIFFSLLRKLVHTGLRFCNAGMAFFLRKRVALIPCTIEPEGNRLPGITFSLIKGSGLAYSEILFHPVENRICGVP